MANYLLKPGEKARTVTTIVWVEDLESGEGTELHYIAIGIVQNYDKHQRTS